MLVTHDQAEALSFADQVARSCTTAGSPRSARRPRSTAPPPTGTPRRSSAMPWFLRGNADGTDVSTALGLLAVHQPGTRRDRRRAHPPRADPVRDMAPGIPCAEVLSTTYFGHDALVALRLQADHTVVTARVNGSDVPHTGSMRRAVRGGRGQGVRGPLTCRYRNGANWPRFHRNHGSDPRNAANWPLFWEGGRG